MKIYPTMTVLISIIFIFGISGCLGGGDEGGGISPWISIYAPAESGTADVYNVSEITVSGQSFTLPTDEVRESFRCTDIYGYNCETVYIFVTGITVTIINETTGQTVDSVRLEAGGIWSIVLPVVFGYNKITVQASDSNGHVANDSIIVHVIDTISPSTPAITAESDGLTTLSLTWGRSSDNDIVDHYQLYKDGSEFIDVPAGDTSSSVNFYEFSDIMEEQSPMHCYQVVARDRFDNASAPSIKSCASTAMNTTIERVIPDALQRPDFALDSRDFAHVVYSPLDCTVIPCEPGPIKYATNSTGYWAVTSLFPVITYSTLDATPVIILDESDAAHVVFCRYVPRYMTNQSGSWQQTDLNFWCQRPAIARDSSGNIHVTNVIGAPSDDKQLVYSADISSSTVRSYYTNTIFARDSVIRLDSNDFVHIAYHGAGKIYYASNSSGSWRTMTVASSPISGSNETGWDVPAFDLAIDSADNPHICYRDNGTHAMMHAVLVGNTWTKENINEDRVVSYPRISLNIDPEDNLHVTYGSIYKGTQAYYSVKDVTGWQTYDIAFSNSQTGGITSKLDSRGRLHVVRGGSDTEGSFYKYSIYSRD